MKKLLLLSTLLLAGCDGISTFLDAEIHRDAKQAFLAASGNAIQIDEANAVAPVTTQVTVVRDATGMPTGEIYFLIPGQCTQHWRLETMEGYDPFWLGNGTPESPSAWYVTYDSAESQCGPRNCGGTYIARMVGATGIVTIGCESL